MPGGLADFVTEIFLTGAGQTTIIVPSVDKGRRGFDGQKCAHTASSPLEIRQVFPAGFSLSGHISARQNCFAPAAMDFQAIFWLLRAAGGLVPAKVRRTKIAAKALTGVFALINRW